MSTKKAEALDVPTGDALRNVLRHFYSGCGYVLYGDRVEPHEVNGEPARGLVWDEENEVSRPTARVLIEKWKELKSLEEVKFQIAERDWVEFKESAWSLLQKIFTCQDQTALRAFLYLIDNPVKDLSAWTKAFKQVRAALPQDWRSEEVDQIWAIAQENGILIDRDALDL